MQSFSKTNEGASSPEAISITAKAHRNDQKNKSLPQWKDRGWYLAVEYGLLPGKERFLQRLDKIRQLGHFKELLEAGGKITYRNLFRGTQIQDAWNLLTILQPWKNKVSLYLNGENLPWKAASEIVWCAGFLIKEQPCRGDYSNRRYDLGCERKLNFAPFQWNRVEDLRRHIFTFATLDQNGVYQFDHQAIIQFLAKGRRGRDCPLSPARYDDLIHKALQPINTQSLGWSVIARMSQKLRKIIGSPALKREHSFQRSPKAPTLLGPIGLEIFRHNSQPALVLASDPHGQIISEETDLNQRLNNALQQNDIRIPAKRKGERYLRTPGRRNEIEHVFTLEDMIVLDPQRDPTEFPLFDLEPVPENTPAYQSWAKSTMESLHLCNSSS